MTMLVRFTPRETLTSIKKWNVTVRLTPGKIYRTIKMEYNLPGLSDEYYIIEDDTGITLPYPKDHFIPIPEERDSKIDKILD